MAKVIIEGVNLQNEDGWDGTGGALPPGNYLLRVNEVEHKAANTGNPQMVLKCEVVDCAESQALIGRNVMHFIMLMASTKGRVKHMLDVCGVEIDADGGFDSDGFVLKEFAAVLESNTYEKADPATGTTVTKTNVKIQQERPASEWETILAELGVGSEGNAEDAPVTKPVAAPAAKPAVAARPIAKQQQPLPPPGASVAVPPPANAGVPAGQPRLATGLPKPGTRVAVRR